MLDDRVIARVSDEFGGDRRIGPAYPKIDQVHPEFGHLRVAIIEPVKVRDGLKSVVKRQHSILEDFHELPCGRLDVVFRFEGARERLLISKNPPSNARNGSRINLFLRLDFGDFVINLVERMAPNVNGGLNGVSTDFLVKIERVVVLQIAALSFEPTNLLEKAEPFLGHGRLDLAQ